jgi:arylformamidase
VSTALYREFTTVEELDAQYDIEASVPDFGLYVEQFVSRSAAARAALGPRLDVPYGPTLAETFDVFPGAGPAPAAGRPALLFVHGGYWKVTTSKEWSYVATGLVERGVTVVVENYALCPAVTVREIVRQHRAAFATLYRDADTLGVDRSRIVVAGHSAGGHGVACLAGTDWRGQYGLLPTTPIAGVVGISGLYDLRPLPRTFVGPHLGLGAGEAAALSPQLHLPATLPPTVLAHGTAETAEFGRQTCDYAVALQGRGLDVEVVALPRNHFDILDDLADPEGPLARAVVRLVGAVT